MDTPGVSGRTMAHRIYLLISCLCYGATSLNTAITGPHDICLRETFNASCPENHVVIMRSALFGRMSLGRCAKQDFGYIGCESDAVRLMDGLCSGRRSCQVKTNSDALLAISTCPDDTTGFLRAAYSCIPVAIGSSHQCHQNGKVTLTHPGGFLSSFSSMQHGIGTERCPWLIQASPGMRLNITLYNFAATPETQGVLSAESSVCYEVGLIKEGDASKTVLVCGGDSRQKVVHISNGGPVEVSFVDKSVLDTLGHFLIHYEAVGCAQPAVPPQAHVRRDGPGRVVVRCNHTDKTWTLNCLDGAWSGGPIDCPYDPSWSAAGLYQSDNFPYGILIVVAIGVALGVFIGGLLLSLAIYYIRRRQPPPVSHPEEASSALGPSGTDQNKFPSSGDIVDPRSPSWGVYGSQPPRPPYYNRQNSTISQDPDKDIYATRHHVYETPQIS